MSQLTIISHYKVAEIFKNYPPEVRHKMEGLRKLVLETAAEIEDLTYLEEALKWGEPSFLTKNGSTLRMDWKPKNPLQYALYFQCSSKLIPTFRMLYQGTLQFEGSRAILLNLEEPLPKEVLKKCITATLTYHKVKNLPTLGL